MSYIGEKELTDEQFRWLDGWLNLWGRGYILVVSIFA